MFIIDSQVHIWAPETPDKPYAKENASAPHRARPSATTNCCARWTAPVSRVAFSCRPPGKPTATILRWKRRGCTPIASASWATGVDQSQQPGVDGRLETTTVHVGHRMVFNRGQSAQWLNDGTADWFWDAAEKYDIPVMTLAPERCAQARRSRRTPSGAAADRRSHGVEFGTARQTA